MATISGVGTTATVNASSSRSGNTVTVTCTGSVTVNVSAYTGSVYAEVYINGSYVGRIGNANGSKSLSITQTTNAQTVASYAKFYLEETQKSTMTEKTYSGTVTCSNQTIPALTPSSPTVYYSANGGSGAPSGGTTWPSGSNFTVSSTVPTRENYTFNGWAYTYDGITYTVESGGTIPAARRSTMTLYAVWVSRYEDLTGWVISAQRSSQRWLGAAARILLADDSTDGAYHLIAEYSFYQFATSVNEWLNIYKALADGTYQRENIPVTSNYVGVSGLTITEDLGVYGYNETVSTRAFYCRWYPSSGGYLDSNTAQATYTTPVIRYAISYDANGGTGTMSNTVKIAGETVTISACGFAKTDYHFLKWNTAANGSGVDYAAGASFSTDGNLALYAIWEADHVYPYFTNVPSVVRAESGGTASDYGDYLKVTFNWQLETGYTSATAKIEYQETGAFSWTTLVAAGALSGNTGTYTYTSSSAVFTNDKSYNVRITLTDAVGSGEPFLTFISNCLFPFDLYGGSSVAIGTPAPETIPTGASGVFTLGGDWDMQMNLDTSETLDSDLEDAITAAGITGVYNDTDVLSAKKLLTSILGALGGVEIFTSGTHAFDQTAYSYVCLKFANGALIAAFSTKVAAGTGSNYNGEYYRSYTGIKLPSAQDASAPAFIEAPYIVTQCRATTNLLSVHFTWIAATTVDIWLHGPNSSIPATSIDFLCIGRWK